MAVVIYPGTYTMANTFVPALVALQFFTFRFAPANATYTMFNAALLALVIVFPLLRRAYLPLAMSNTLALHAAFYGLGLLIDRDFYANMRRKNGWSMAKFLAGDAALHVLPSAVFIWDFFRDRAAWRARILDAPFFGLEALLLNLTWGYMAGRFRLDDVYVASATSNWVTAWSINVAAHLAAAHAMTALCHIRPLAAP